MEATYEVWRNYREHNDETKNFVVVHKAYASSKSEGLIVAIFPVSDRYLDREQKQRAHDFAKMLNEEVVTAEAYSKLVKEK